MAEGGSFLSAGVGEPNRRAFLELDRRLAGVQATIDALSPAHGDLTGLGDDDHPQYLTEARGDARYANIGSSPTITLAGDATGSVTLTNLGNGTLSVTVADDSHNHTIANVDNLQSSLDGKAASSHTHSYLPLSGGTVTGNLTAQGNMYVGKNGGGDSYLYFYDDNSNAWREIFWDDSENRFRSSHNIKFDGYVHSKNNFYVGDNGMGDSDIYFYDDNSNTWRTMRWDDSANDWRVEDNGGSMRILYHSGNIPSYYATGSSVRAIYYNGYGNAEITAYQTSGNWQTWTGGWATHIIGNHGNGSNYYNHTLILPFWGQPHYMRKEGGTNRGPWVLYGSENSNNSGSNWTIGRAYVHNEIFVYNMDTTWSYNTVRYNTNGQLMAYASLREMKDDITEINPLLDYLGERSLLYDLNPVIFKESEERIGKDGQPLYTTRGEYAPGFIAEEVHEVAPELTYFDYKGDLVSYANDALIPHVVAELQRLMPMIEELYGAANPDWVPPSPRPSARAETEKAIYNVAAQYQAENPTEFLDQPEGASSLQPNHDLVDLPEEKE